MRIMTFRPRRLLALFTIRTRLEAFAIIYALGLGATQRGSAYLHQFPGWGGRLLQTALDWLQREGPRTLWLGVWSENHGAQRLYARHGFHKVGDYLFPVGAINDLEFILRRPADAAPR